jgi:D-sedoheptulose 7-phosphate isomerase
MRLEIEEKVFLMLKQARTIWILGDGGSAATADHFACDLLKGCGLPAVSLCSNAALITAIGNDFSFSEIFLLQLQCLYRPNDLIVIFSTSGNSENLVKATEVIFAKTLAICGNHGGKLKDKVNYLYDLQTNDQQKAEDRMSEFCHIIYRNWKEMTE